MCHLTGVAITVTSTHFPNSAGIKKNPISSINLSKGSHPKLLQTSLHRYLHRWCAISLWRMPPQSRRHQRGCHTCNIFVHDLDLASTKIRLWSTISCTKFCLSSTLYSLEQLVMIVVPVAMWFLTNRTQQLSGQISRSNFFCLTIYHAKHPLSLHDTMIFDFHNPILH